MKKVPRLIAVMVMLGVICTVEVFAQEGIVRKGEEAWGPCRYYARMYDRYSVEIVAGQAVSAEEFRPVKGISCGVQIILKTDKGTIPIHLGPAWYIENQDVKIVPGDRVEVTGSRITFEGKPALVAAEVKKGNEVLTLRQMDGFPMWAKFIDWSSYHWGE